MLKIKNEIKNEINRETEMVEDYRSHFIIFS